MAHDTLYAIGEALIDMIPAETGCDFGAVSSFAPRVGGAPANVAAAFARLGGRSALLTQLGDDPFGAKITAELAGAGVDVSHIATTDRANTALAFVSLQADGNRTFSFYRKPGADMLMRPDQLREEGHKVLVFSQFVSMLEIIKNRLEAENRPLNYLTGQTKDRRGEIEKFQTTKDPSVFLLSLKAGGAGLNLTSASYVVLYDPWWNPAVESQAIDRTHRIGQKNKVIAYRLLTKDSVEEKIRILQHQKNQLVANVLGDEGFTSSLGIDDLNFILNHGDDEEG